MHIVQNNIYYRGSETVTWIRGDHTLKIGGDFSHLMVGYDQGSSQNGIINFSGNYSGDSFGDYLLGLSRFGHRRAGQSRQLWRRRQVLARRPDFTGTCRMIGESANGSP